MHNLRKTREIRQYVRNVSHEIIYIVMEGEKSLAWVAGGVVGARDKFLAAEPLIEVLLLIFLAASLSLLAAPTPKLYCARLQYRQADLPLTKRLKTHENRQTNERSLSLTRVYFRSRG